MYIRALTIILVLLSFLSCRDNDTEHKNESTTIPVADSATVQHMNVTNTFYKRLEGSIAGKPVVMHLSKYNGKIDANYYYMDQGQPVFLFKDWDTDTQSDTIYLSEQTNNANTIPNKIKLVISDNEIKGVWGSGDGKRTYPFTLKEGYPENSYKLNAIENSDSIFYHKFKKEPPALISAMGLLTMPESDETGKWFNNFLKNIIFNGNHNYAAMNIPEAMKVSAEKEKTAYLREMDSICADKDFDPSESHAYLNREYQTLSNIIYNRNGFVVMSVMNYGYYGGAHGMYSTSMYCIDMIHKKQLKMSDIVKIDSVLLQHLVEKNFRKQSLLGPSQPLSDILFNNHLTANENFYFTSGGLGFLYAPYEIVSFAQGEMNVWVPFNELKPFLVPEFAKRMEL